MRVIAGEAKGRRLKAPGGVKDMRPTTDRTRTSIFDMLGSGIAGARVLDLFAGSGALGIEALSRGAAEAEFVEVSRQACGAIAENLETTGFAARGRVRKAQAERWVGKRAKVPFDLVFLDPPYDRGLGFVVRVLEKLAAGGWLAPGATIVVEAEPGQIRWPQGFRETKARRFGRTQASMAVVEDGKHGADRDLPGNV